jgi:hypothetical protein
MGVAPDSNLVDYKSNLVDYDCQAISARESAANLIFLSEPSRGIHTKERRKKEALRGRKGGSDPGGPWQAVTISVPAFAEMAKFRSEING